MKYFISFLLILTLAVPILAEDSEGFKWDQGGQTRGYFRGGAGGYELFMLPIELDAINNNLTQIGLPAFKSEMFLQGGGGWGFIGNNIRIGGFGAGGTLTSNAKINNIGKEVSLELGIGGFIIEKAFHPFNSMEIYLGASVGGGSATLKLLQWAGPVDWNEVWGVGYASESDTIAHAFYDYQTTFSCSFFTAMPVIGVRYNIFRWIAIGAKVGYLYTHIDENGWKMEDRKVYGVPEIDFSNVIYGINIYFGG
jgi:hypothetical protein